MSVPASPPRRRLANGIIVAFLALQIGAPLSYYLGENRYDERFAWRMFSPIRVAQCSARLYASSGGTEREIRLFQELHVVWINLLKRARTTVLDRYAEKWCAEGEGRELRVDLTCVPPEASRHPICRGIVDRDGDGVPEGFRDHEACATDTVQGCYQRLCGDAAPRDCHSTHCVERIVPRDRDLCGGGT